MSKILNILKETNAIITNSHFVYTSGKHGSVYINKDIVYIHPERASEVGELFARQFKDFDIDVVAAPALGGIILSQWTAYHLSKIKNKEVLGVYTEKTLDKDQVFTRGYEEVVKGKNVLVIEDLTTTGESVKKVINSVKKSGGVVAAVGVMINRDPAKINSKSIGEPFFSLGVFKAEAFNQGRCPLCKLKIAINTTVGHGKKFLKIASKR